MQYQLRISGRHYDHLRQHLFPGDQKEAVAVALCGFHLHKDRTLLLVHQLFPVVYEKCERSSDYVHWKTEIILPVLEKAMKSGFSLIKIHSHPTGYPKFSQLDDDSDLKLFPSVYGWVDGDNPHGSFIMLPDGKIFGRIITKDNTFIAINKVSVTGDRIVIWQTQEYQINKELSLRNSQTLGEGTVRILKSMKIGIVGASGTGSPTIEQLVRLGLGKIVLIDPDRVEKKNLNRILNTTLSCAEKKEYKVDVIMDMIHRIGFGTEVLSFSENLYDSREAIEQLISCDVIFGCVDSIDGRHLLNQISTFYLIPYIDLGVKIVADGNGGIEQINSAVHFIQPGGSSLISRGVYNIQTLESASLLRQDPKEYKRRAREKYIVNLPVDSPAVISINMMVSSFAINEFLDRIHPFKATEPQERAINWLSISEGLIFSEPDGEPDLYLQRKVGRGDIKPFLEMVEL